MKPIAILSSDFTPDYFSLIPIVAVSWHLQGFKPVIILNSYGVDAEKKRKEIQLINVLKFYLGIVMPLDSFDLQVHNIGGHEGNRALYTQCVRLYKYCIKECTPDQYIIIGDIDMFIASSFLYRDFHKVNVFGHDLTGYGQVPMCYVGMSAISWAEVMDEEDVSLPLKERIDKDIEKYADVNSDDFYRRWGADQDILTAKLKAFGFEKINFITRGTDSANSGLPLGRWDRHNWQKPLNQEIHDVHLMRNPLSDENFSKILEMCQTIYPAKDWSWLNNYKHAFNEAIKQTTVQEQTSTNLHETASDNNPDILTQLDELHQVKAAPSMQEILDANVEADKWGFTKNIQNWDNHRILLYIGLLLTDGSVVEYGCGDGSTPYLRDYCKEMNRSFTSYDSNREWANKLGAIYVQDWDKENVFQNCSLAFIDHAPGEHRYKAIELLKDKADIIVVHDTEENGAGDYKYDRIWHYFKYRINHNRTGGGAGVSILSNKVNLDVLDGCQINGFFLEKKK